MKVASLQYDVIFKKAFSHKEVFVAFVQDCLGITLEIDQVETEKRFDIELGHIRPRFDLFAEDKKNRIIVDIQHARYPDNYDRFLHYHCAALLEQAAKASDYRPRLQVFTIVVLTSGDKYQTDVAVTDFDPRKPDGTPLGVFRHKLLFLCPKYVSEQTPEPLREWLLAINDSLDGEVAAEQYQLPAIQSVFDYIEQDLISPDERARMKDEYSQDLLLQEKYEEGRTATVRSMLAEGLDIALISRVTGLSQEEVRALSMS
jgi:hypothetical protein